MTSPSTPVEPTAAQGAGHAGCQVWSLSSALVLVGWLVFIAYRARTQEYRANLAAGFEATRPRWAVVRDIVPRARAPRPGSSGSGGSRRASARCPAGGTARCAAIDRAEALDVAADRRAEESAMQDVELFLSLAEIAGVFVGFGALIAVRSGGTANAIEVASIGMVVVFAVVVVAVALAPVAISRFGVTGHGLWLASSIIALVGIFGAMVLWERAPGEVQEFVAARAPLRARAKVEVAGFALWGPTLAALGLVVLGVVPDQEAALYFAALVLLLLMDAAMLLLVVFRVGLPRVAEPGAEAAPGSPTTRA